MNVLRELRNRFRPALESLGGESAPLLEMIRPAQDPRYGDYQANCAMPLGKRLGRPPREVAAELVRRVELGDLCEPPEVAGPGFINLRLRREALAAALEQAARDERLGVPPASEPKTYVVDYSSPNVAKPMHVGHLRSTVIGDAIARMLQFQGHRVIRDNHLGDWGLQFGMILYGYKHFRDDAAYRSAPVHELSRLYLLVNRLISYQQASRSAPEWERRAAERAEAAAAQRRAADEAEAAGDATLARKAAKAARRAEAQAEAARQELAALRRNLAAVESDPKLARLAAEHPNIEAAVLEETAKLHAGDQENRRLWREFLPACRSEIQRIYERLDIRFDVEYGESFYQDQLADVVRDLEQRGLARRSEGAVCVFLDGFDTPMIVQKRDGAFLYATTDLATIRYRMERWRPDGILYVVDHRQSEHFAKLFAAARRWGYRDVELRHISFGAVLDRSGRPFKTREGAAASLEELLDRAVQKAYDVVTANDEAKPGGAELSDQERRRIAEVVGHAAVKYADLSHNRTSDYVFDYDKMMALEGNTATYLQYCYARTQSIFARGGLDSGRPPEGPFQLHHPSERALAMALIRLPEAIDEALADYRPNVLAAHLFELAKRFSEFYEQCPVLRAEQEAVRTSRLRLCDLTGRTIRLGLQLLGIHVVDRM